jgi:tRNA pseudouridine55 synthase
MAALHGILNLNKPAGWTSHDVVARVRRILGQRRVGHAGTLDPLATGVLLVGVGQGTRVLEYLMKGQKVYRAVARLGIVTNTYDIQGQIIATAEVPDLTRTELETALRPFCGEIQQTPPAYSAVKQQGEPAYRRARRGAELQLTPRLVTIERIELQAWQPPLLTLEVHCSPGTYIRSLIHDLGQALGCGATLVELTRLRSGHFTLEEAISLETLAAAATKGDLDRYLHPLQAALADLLPVHVTAEEIACLVHGQAIPCPYHPPAATGYALAPDGAVVAILAYSARTGQWLPHKVLWPTANHP